MSQIQLLRDELATARTNFTTLQALSTRSVTMMQQVGAIVRPSSEENLLRELQEIMVFATQAKAAQTQFIELVARLRVSGDAEARSIGNSIDALFRATPVPEVLANR